MRPMLLTLARVRAGDQRADLKVRSQSGLALRQPRGQDLETRTLISGKVENLKLGLGDESERVIGYGHRSTSELATHSTALAPRLTRLLPFFLALTALGRGDGSSLLADLEPPTSPRHGDDAAHDQDDSEQAEDQNVEHGSLNHTPRRRSLDLAVRYRHSTSCGHWAGRSSATTVSYDGLVREAANAFSHLVVPMCFVSRHADCILRLTSDHRKSDQQRHYRLSHTSAPSEPLMKTKGTHGRLKEAPTAPHSGGYPPHPGSGPGRFASPTPTVTVS